MGNQKIYLRFFFIDINYGILSYNKFKIDFFEYNVFYVNDFTPSSPLAIEESIDQYLRTILAT